MRSKIKLAAMAVLMSSFIGSTADASVDRGAKEYDGHYYKVYDKSMTWDRAQEYCEKMGGHLVTINSSGEQDFVSRLISSKGNRNCYWIGGVRSSNRHWKWVTDENFSYTNWAEGQPDNFTDEEDSLMMYRRKNPSSSSHLGQWNDIRYDGDCNGEDFFGKKNFGFVCEWDSDGSRSERRSRWSY
ncbi:MAG: C-type lectin domain-containing protein [Selenomonadaceae bacterium]|nr:C-type lectin domain-containing protein [Selenomonadaceae bacterium]